MLSIQWAHVTFHRMSSWFSSLWARTQTRAATLAMLLIIKIVPTWLLMVHLSPASVSDSDDPLCSQWSQALPSPSTISSGLQRAAPLDFSVMLCSPFISTFLVALVGRLFFMPPRGAVSGSRNASKD
uniref:Uncharacterized protein n=1 Tax=Myotis myotis TaxID=51298 RepID=A0A7J8AM87_MYOMY|nr:hypothetical protein mMyoMyo1_007874 [Myotis myotis]